MQLLFGQVLIVLNAILVNFLNQNILCLDSGMVEYIRKQLIFYNFYLSMGYKQPLLLMILRKDYLLD